MTRDLLMVRMFRLGPMVAAVALLLPQPAGADANLTTSNKIWKQMDNCTRAAQKKFPDYTAESNAKREAYRQNCLRAGNLPGDEGLPPPQQPAQRQPAPQP